MFLRGSAPPGMLKTADLSTCTICGLQLKQVQLKRKEVAEKTSQHKLITFQVFSADFFFAVVFIIKLKCNFVKIFQRK